MVKIAKGTRTIEKGWHKFYAPYVKIEEIELPPVDIGDAVNVKKIMLHEKETQPPKRFTPASIIKELERRNLGTKATRSEIIETLFQRGYIDGTPIRATNLGIKTIETLKEHAPKIIDEAFLDYILMPTPKECLSFYDDFYLHHDFVLEMDPKDRISSYKVEYDQSKIELIKIKVEAARKYANTLVFGG